MGGAVPLPAQWQQRTLQFKPAAVEVTLQVAFTTTRAAKAGVKWWLIEAGGELAREKVATQTVKLTLEPVLLDEHGDQVELSIDAAEDADNLVTGGDDGDEQLLDAPD